jgi:hypothetical protein
MNDMTRTRLGEILRGIEAGTSPLTPKDVCDALAMALIPTDAPSMVDDQFTQVLGGLAGDHAHVAAGTMDLLLTILETRLKSLEPRTDSPHW